jgi:hypothetical protein
MLFPKLISRERHTLPPGHIVAIPTTAPITITTATIVEAIESICSFDYVQLASDLHPLRRQPAIEPARTGNTLELLRLLEHSRSLVATVIQISPIPKPGFQSSNRISKFSCFLVHLVFTSSAIPATAIQRAVQIPLEVFRQAVKAVNRVTQFTLIVPASAVIGISSLSGYHDWQSKREQRGSHN